MPINAKNKPGCPCCQCECDDGTLYPQFTRIKVTISGLKSSYTWKNGVVYSPGGGTIATSTITGLDEINGTHFFDIDHTEGNCVDETAYPISPTIVEFEAERAYEEVSYDGDCNETGTISGTETVYFSISVQKDGPTFFSIAAQMSPGPGTPETGFDLVACQDLACDNDFDATVDAGNTNGDGSPCSDGQFAVKYCGTGLSLVYPYNQCSGGTYCSETVADDDWQDDTGATILAEITN
jgi:hypothetical protein